MHLVLTDSGLGGLAICAGVEHALSRVRAHPVGRLTYVNAWPEEGLGYNDFPDMPARAAVFDRVMRRIDAFAPDLVLIACNTLSIVYEHTQHAHVHASTPVHGIVDAGTTLFEESLRHDPSSAIVLIGTRTTIESGAHRQRLLERDIAPERVSGADCHGLATAIETDPHGERTGSLIESCAERAAAAAGAGGLLYVGLCCTHYGFVADRLQGALARHAGRPVEVLDPNRRAIQDLVQHLVGQRAAGTRGGGDQLAVRVVSKVRLEEAKRLRIARLVEPASPATAAALRAYEHVPDLF